MGLDNFWKLPEGVNDPINDVEDLRLFGGMFSGHGKGSFRGKVYANFVSDVTNASLYDDEIPNDQICEMADKFDQCKFEDYKDYFQNQEEFEDFKLMFRRYADAGASLRAWY